jgi:hypothetical protein
MPDMAPMPGSVLALLGTKLDRLENSTQQLILKMTSYVERWMSTAMLAKSFERMVSDESGDLTDGCRRLEELGLIQLKFQNNKTMQTEVAGRLEEALCNA